MLHPPRSTLFPYTTLFRSRRHGAQEEVRRPVGRVDRPHPALEPDARSEEHTSELQSLRQLVCRPVLEKKNRTGLKSAQQVQPKIKLTSTVKSVTEYTKQKM